ncbi:MAG: hypothetical protein AB7S98_06425, partial [Burkholderiaceae bacterium]
CRVRGEAANRLGDRRNLTPTSSALYIFPINWTLILLFGIFGMPTVVELPPQLPVPALPTQRSRL